MTRRNILAAMAALGLASSMTAAHAQNATVQETQTQSVQDVIVSGPDTKMGANAGRQPVAPAKSSDLRADWNKYLQDNNLKEGTNSPPGAATPFIIFMSMVDVASSPTSPNWLLERSNAYQQAILAAKGKVANFISSEVKAGRTSTLFNSAGQGVPSIGQNVAKNLSVMDKMVTLADKSLDNEIKKYDAGWDGTGKTDAQRQERVVQMRRQYEEQISSGAEAFTSGAVPIYTGEGPSRNGYSVLVGIVVSENMRKIARALADPSVVLPPDDPAPPIEQQIRDRYQQDPVFLTSTEGVRIMTDEKGQRSIVCFSGVPESGDSMVTEQEAELSCRGRIAQFVAEQVVVDSRRSGGMAVDKLAPTDTAGAETRVSFDQKMQSQIKAETGKVSMSGLTQIGFYETKHHYSNQDMAIGVYLWNQETSAAARKVKALTEPVRGDAQRQQAPSSSAAASGPAAAPVGRGLTTNPSKF